MSVFNERICLYRKYRLRCARIFLDKRFHEKSPDCPNVLSVRMSGYLVRPNVRSFRSVLISPLSLSKNILANHSPIRFFLFCVALSFILALDTLFNNPRHISQEKSTFGSHSTPPHRSLRFTILIDSLPTESRFHRPLDRIST